MKKILGKRGRLGKSLLLGGISGSLLVALVAVSSASGAEEKNPTEEELLSRCFDADYCVFTPTSMKEGVGKQHQVGEMAINCMGDATRKIGWKDITTVVTEAEISSSLSGDLFDFAKITVNAKFGKKFKKTTETSNDVEKKMEPFSKMWVSRAAPINVITGQWELHFPDRFYGHYYWYDDYTFSVEDPDGNGYVILHYASLSDEEIKEFCPEVVPSVGREKFHTTEILEQPDGQRVKISGMIPGGEVVGK